MHICYACFWTLNAFVIYGIFTHYHFQRNLPPATGSGSSTKTNAVGWAAFWWSEHLLIMNEGVHFLVFVSLRRKKNVRRERITKYLEDCYTAMYFLLSCYQCYFLLPAPAASNLNFSVVYNREMCFICIVVICPVYLFLVGDKEHLFEFESVSLRVYHFSLTVHHSYCFLSLFTG